MFEQDVSLESFLAFATDSDLNGATVLSIVDSNVEVVDSNNEIRTLAHLVTLKKSDAIFEKSDLLEKAGKSYSLQDIQTDDGFLVEISAV